MKCIIDYDLQHYESFYGGENSADPPCIAKYFCVEEIQPMWLIDFLKNIFKLQFYNDFTNSFLL